MKQYEIKHRAAGKRLFTSECISLCQCVEVAIEKGVPLQGADLRGADLQGAYLRGAYLRWADLRSADLRSADLRGADLQSADLQSADLRGADLRGADLRGADLRADLRGADLRGADLQSADLQDEKLTNSDSEKKTNAETMRHILTVRSLLADCCSRLIHRGRVHDLSKLQSPEVEAFTRHTPELAEARYGSEEYRATLARMRPAIDHHHANNPHHPEFHEDGVLGMDLFDVIEMVCDWAAAGLRHQEGSSLGKSLEIAIDRHDLPASIASIILNTIPTIENFVEGHGLRDAYPQGSLKEADPKGR